MDRKEEYLRQAIDAQKWADQSKSEKAKAGWLRVAEQWLTLLRGLPGEREALKQPDFGPASARTSVSVLNEPEAG